MKKIKKQDYTDLVKSISAIAEQMCDLNRRAVIEYTPVVNHLIESKCQDSNKVELTLDYIMDFAGNGDGLALFQRLLEYLKTINLQGAEVYQRYWNEHWNDDEV